MHIDAILFDADVVIQRPSETWRKTWEGILGSTRNLDEFLADVFAAEVPSLEGQSNFPEALSNVLAEWECHGTLQDALDAWTMIEVDPRITDSVRTLRRIGKACYLVTDQEPYRARYMSETLGYRDLFDREFYSCQTGVMKPAAGCFRNILNEIKVQPSQVLFLDDHQINVESAQEVGLHAAVFTVEAGIDELHRILGEFGIHAP
jgi:putative hydrolase of the HAD superfamily